MISVVVPAWNAERTIEETLLSILDQSQPASEIIVVDDGSTDGTPDLPVLRRSPVRVIRQTNQGTAAALNTGIAAATGRYLAFLDADDLWTVDKLREQSAALDANSELSGVFGYVEAFACPSASAEDRSRWDLAACSGPGWLMGAALMRRDHVEGEWLDPQLRTGYFIDWLDRLRLKGCRLSMLPSVVLLRRLHAGSLTHQKSEMASGFLGLAHRALQRRRAQANSRNSDTDGNTDA